MNSVAGRGLVKWTVLDQYGRPHNIEIMAYHVPTASVRLLSPQCVFQTQSLGGNGVQNEHSYTMVLESGATLIASYGRANLPLLSMQDTPSDYTCFWTQCFGVLASEENDWFVHIFNAAKQNSNLLVPQKELLLWHQRLLHVNLFTLFTIFFERSALRRLTRLTISSLFETSHLCLALLSSLALFAIICFAPLVRSPKPHVALQRTIHPTMLHRRRCLSRRVTHNRAFVSAVAIICLPSLAVLSPALVTVQQDMGTMAVLSSWTTAVARFFIIPNAQFQPVIRFEESYSLRGRQPTLV